MFSKPNEVLLKLTFKAYLYSIGPVILKNYNDGVETGGGWRAGEVSEIRVGSTKSDNAKQHQQSQSVWTFILRVFKLSGDNEISFHVFQ